MEHDHKKISFGCTACSNPMQSPAPWGGRPVTCPACGETQTVPRQSDPQVEESLAAKDSDRRSRLEADPPEVVEDPLPFDQVPQDEPAEWMPRNAAEEKRQTRGRRRKVLLYLGATLVAGAMVGGWMYARHVYREDFSAAGRMKKRGFGEQVKPGDLRDQALWQRIRDEEKSFATGGKGFLSAYRLVRTYREVLYATDVPLPDHLRAYVANNAAWFLATTTHFLLRDPTEARSLAEAAVELTRRKEPMYLDTLAEATFQAGRIQDALDIELEALKLDPDAPYLAPQIEKFRKALESRQSVDPPESKNVRRTTIDDQRSTPLIR